MLSEVLTALTTVITRLREELGGQCFRLQDEYREGEEIATASAELGGERWQAASQGLL